MPAVTKSLAVLLPALALLGACTSTTYRTPSDTVIVTPPPAPVLTGALGAPAGPTIVPPMSGSTVPPIAPTMPMRLSAAEISATLAGNTAQGVAADGRPYAAYFSPGGVERFRQGEFADYGSWRVLPDGRFCSTLARLSHAGQECYVMYRAGNTLTFDRPDGVAVGSVTVVAGNPLNL